VDLAAPFPTGVRGHLHAVMLDGSRETGLDPDAPAVPASTIKVLVALEAERSFADGRLDPRERVRVTDANRTTGPVGMSLQQDELETSLRDLMVPMLTYSDNVATDLLIERLGLEALQDAAQGLGMTGTRIACDLRTMIDRFAVDAGFAGWAAVEASTADAVDVARRIRAAQTLRPEHALMGTTARDLTRLLRAVWAEPAGEGIRFLMARQVTRDRIARGFGPGWRVAAKSGGLFGVWRNEVGVVTSPDGVSVAVAVLTRADGGHDDAREVDDAIGEAAAAAVREVLGSSA
jgi:beta-lactamase class A